MTTKATKEKVVGEEIRRRLKHAAILTKAELKEMTKKAEKNLKISE